MPSHKAAIWAGATGATVVVAAAAAAYWTHPVVIWPQPVPAAVTEQAPPPPAVPAAVAKRERASAETAPAAGPPPTATAPLVESAAVKPAFDVVTVDPAGEAVVAGRAAPNAKVELKDRGKTVAEATTDAQGDFVMTPPALPPGEHSLSLATGSGPLQETSNAIAVAVAAPEPPKSGSPGAAAPTPPPSVGGERVAIQSIEAIAGGELVAKGAAEPNALVRLYVSGAIVGDAKTKADGRWSLTIERGMTPGDYLIRADEINPADAKVLARAEAPFNYPAASAVAGAAPPAAPSPADVVVNELKTAHVVAGNTLWGLSQTFFGDGSRYMVILAANANQIRDPHWIYPGQTFVVPKVEPKP